MVMTHYMELLSLHQPWFLILFMLVPMVLAETILAAGVISLIDGDARSARWDSLSHAASLILGVFFIFAAGYIVISYMPTILWRGPIDYIAVWSYVLAIIPAVLLILFELGVVCKNADVEKRLKRHTLLMILFIFFTHMAMVFGMADPQLAGYVPPQQTMNMQMNMQNGQMNHDMSNQPMDHQHMHHQMNDQQMNNQQNMNMNQQSSDANK